ncbi:MAG: DUF4982 domain-containing protein [Treponema sp.]|nr:DUF4982 domain-containing protein [Treponema sp.]
MQLFNQDWKFLLGDPKNAELEDYNDRTWKHIDLPHDWVVHQPFNKGEDEGWTHESMQGFFIWKNTGWYRKEFFLDGGSDKEIYLYFGCAYRNAVIYINGKKAGTHAYGYTSFELCISSFVRPGKNLVAIRLDNGSNVPDRWYSGAGLFRNVFLRQVSKLHFTTWGLGVKAVIQNNGSAEIKVTACIENTSAQEESSCLNLVLNDTDGKQITGKKITLNAASKSETVLEHCFYINNPELWSDINPRLYQICAFIGDTAAKASCGDYKETKFGIRTIELTAHKGFIINGRNIKLKGVCLHHDCGILGAAFYQDAWRRRLTVLKSIGCNAIRTSHNPQAEEFLDLCDELGFYIIDECFDRWKSLSYEKIFDDNWKQDLHGFILRDRNHPCVFCWSVGNEVENQGSAEMLKIERMLCDYVRTLDDRPVTVALSPHVTEKTPRDLVGAPPEKYTEITGRISEYVDVLGLNYHEPWYPYYSKAINKPIIGTECYEYYSGTLGSFEDFTKKNPWRYVLEDNNVLGQFIWAGIDYFGEASWPSKGWTGSSLDICGFYKDQTWLRKSFWSSESVVHLCFYDNTQKNNLARGRWNFPYTASHLNLNHMERRTVTAAVYTNCDEIELWINGKKIGRRRPVDYENGIIEWPFDYAGGELKVIGFRDGKEAAVQEMKTAGAPAVIALNADKIILTPSGLAHIEVNITDENGIINPTEDFLLGFSLEGDGEIMGASSPDMNNSLGFDLPRVYTSGGKALVIIKAGAAAGELIFSAYGGNLKGGKMCFTVKRSS